MDVDKLFGLPAHPLLVHIPVVFVPLAALGAVLIVAVPGWRRRYGVLVAILAGIGAVGIQLAYGSGEALRDRVDNTAAIERHVDLAGTARPLVFVFFVVVVAFVVVTRRLGIRAVEPSHREAEDDAPAGEGSGGVATVTALPTSSRPKVAAASVVVVAVLAVLTVASAATATVWTVRTGHQGADATWRGTGESVPSGGG